MSLLTYKYYDTPEGHDIFKKTFVMSKYAAAAGFSAFTFDALMLSHTKTIGSTFSRFLYFNGPLIGMASAFAVTANAAQNYRKKNDMLNYFLGGVASGAVFGAWQKSVTVGVPMALFLGAIAIVKKVGVDEGWVFLPSVPVMKENAVSAKHDWTFGKDLEHLKGWTSGKQ